MQRDSILNTFLVAVSVCLVCSFLVSSAAVGLRPLQQKNAEKDRKQNILQAAGFTPEQIEDEGGVFKLFEARVEPIIIDLSSASGKVWKTSSRPIRMTVSKPKKTPSTDTTRFRRPTRRRRAVPGVRQQERRHCRYQPRGKIQPRLSDQG